MSRDHRPALQGRGREPELIAMCGRFTQKFTWHEICCDLYELGGDARNLQIHCNIAPTDTVEVVRLDTRARSAGSVGSSDGLGARGRPASFTLRQDDRARGPDASPIRTQLQAS
jgi:hypothetical protein